MKRNWTGRCGIVMFTHKHLGYGIDHGRFIWLPAWAKEVIVEGWNFVASRLVRRRGL